jgi:predicted nucleic acid-binding protein
LNSWASRSATLKQSSRLEQLAAFARPYQLTAYDAAYLHVAETKSATMLTLDQNLIDAAKRLAIPSLRT